MYQEHYEFYENYHGQSGTREILDSETGVSVYWYNGSFEHEGESFDFIGCMREDYNSKLQTVLTMYIGAIDASELEIRKEYLKMVSISEKNPAMEQETEEDVKVSHIFSYPTEEMVAKDLKENINWDILNWVPMKYEKYSFSPVTFERSEGDKAYYSQI